MLTELHLENFKAWRELTIEFGRITALFGENSSGKSSALQFLLLLKQTKELWCLDNENAVLHRRSPGSPHSHDRRAGCHAAGRRPA